MPATVTGIHLGPDTHANRPAANASGLPIGSLYSCTDHGLIYITDGSAWSTWATLGGGAGSGLTASTLGRTTVGASALALTHARVFCRKITVASAGILVSIRANLDWTTLDTAQVSAVLLTDNAGAPYTVIAADNPGTRNTNGHWALDARGARWLTFPIGADVTATDYWIGVVGWKSSGPPINIAYDATGGAGQYWTNPGDYLTDAGTLTVTTHDYSIYANILS